MLTGLIYARTCPACGHHEVGLLDSDGVFHPLKTGEPITVHCAMEPANEQPDDLKA